MMNASTVILIAFFTSVVTTGGTVFVLGRAGMLVPAPAPSAAPSEQLVPDFSGLTETDARANANIAHVALIIAGREAAAGKKPGTIVRQSIPAGQRVPKDQPISVVLADELPRVPNVAKVTSAEATARLERAGFRAVVAAQSADAVVPEGSVISQAPSADEPLDKGGTVTLTVSLGPAAVEVPRVTGMVAQTAKAALEKVGLKVTVEWVSVAESQGLIVLRQTPAAGEKAKPGSEVHLVANQ
jgi:beta-lactam-binding protein with PASTA domain